MLKISSCRDSAPGRRHPLRRGFTLIELLVVISIIATLMSLILPAIQNAREAGRRTQCLNNIRNVTVACMNFASANPKGHLPALSYYPPGAAVSGSPIVPFIEGRSWVVDILPYMDQQSTYDRWQFDQPWDSAANLPLAGSLFIEALACPNDESAYQIEGGLSYVANAGFGTSVDGADAATQNRGHTFFDAAFDWNSDGVVSRPEDYEITFHTGVFWPILNNGGFKKLCQNRCTAPGKIYDGSGNTLMLSENLNAGQTNWANPSLTSCGFMLPLNGTGSSPGDTNKVSNVVLSNTPLATQTGTTPYINQMKTGPEGSPFPSSSHPGIVTASFCDGSAKSLSENIDQYVYSQLMTPNGTRLRTLTGVQFTAENPVSSSDF